MRKIFIYKIIFMVTIFAPSSLLCLDKFYRFENRDIFITKLYEKIMQRSPSNKEKEYWISKLDENKSATFILKAFFRSKEFEDKNLNEEEYVKTLYDTVLEREADKEGLDYWVNEMVNKNIFKDQILYKFSFSSEFKNLLLNRYNITAFNSDDKLTAFIERFYNILFNRRGDYKGVAYWKNEILSQKSAGDIASYFFFSKEFEEKNYDDEMFITLAYRTLLDREPDNGGKTFWLSLFDQGIRKKEIIKNFISSDEFINLLLQYGITSDKNNIPDFALPVGEIKTLPENYGSWGGYKTKRVSYAGNYDKDITLFYPVTKDKVPAVFFSPGWYDNQSISYKKYEVLLEFIASKGYAAVFVPYTQSYQLYEEIKNGFLETAFRYSGIIDTSKVGLLGFSAGGGIIVSMGYQLFKEEGWGENGRFLFLLSPWYDLGMKVYNDKGSFILSDYPSDTKMIIQRYDEDEDDPRILIDLYKNINIPNSEKDFLIINSSPNYEAVHTIPYSPKYQADALDYYAIFRYIDALSAYTFKKDPKAKDIALGNGKKEQITLTKGLSDITVTDEPQDIIEFKPSYSYPYPCTRDLNPRAEFCFKFAPK